MIGDITNLATSASTSPSMLAQATRCALSASRSVGRPFETVKSALRERVERLAAALERELPDARFTPPEGGYFMWVDLPEGTDVDALFDAASERDVAFVKGTDFMLEGGESSLRLACSGVTPDEIEEGVSRLADAYRAISAAAPSPS